MRPKSLQAQLEVVSGLYPGRGPWQCMEQNFFRRDPCAFLAQEQFGAGGWVTQWSAPLGDRVAAGASPATPDTIYSPNTTSSSQAANFHSPLKGDSCHYPHLAPTTGRLNPNPSKTRQKWMLFYNGEAKPKPDSACWPTQMGKKGEVEEGKEVMNVPKKKANYLIIFLNSLYYLSSLLLLLSSSSHMHSPCQRGH